MMIETTMYTPGSVDPARAAALVGALQAAGVSVRERDSQGNLQPGIVLFHTPDDSLISVLRSLSRSGQARLLAISLQENPSEKAWALLQAGAADVVGCIDDAQLAARVAARLRRWSEVEALIDSPVIRSNLRGHSPAWRRALRCIVEAARFTDSPVLISGESGTGKELAARLIHTLDGRPGKGELVVLDCTTIVPELAGSELFGHERGAFTGAMASREGAFALADGGTLFLDEIGELPLPLQAQLLRAIQERSYKRVGGNQWLKAHFRLICATNRDLQAEVGSGTFRADLYYRIAGWTCELPALCKRIEDVLLLAAHFFRPDSPPTDVFDPLVCEYLLRRPFPGNVRELRQLIERIRTRHVGEGAVTVGDLPEEERLNHATAAADWCDLEFECAIRRAMCMGVKLKELSQFATDTAVRVVVQEEDGNLQRAARRLGVTDRALQLRRANELQSSS